MSNLSPPRTTKSELVTLNYDEQIVYQEMLANEKWSKASTFREQCNIIREYLRNGTVMVSYEPLGEMFGGKQFKKIEREERDELKTSFNRRTKNFFD